jgi:hypothetical protein
MQVNNYNDLRKFMIEEIEMQRKGESTPAKVNSVANMAGKINATIKTELEYNKMTGNVPSIDFLNHLNDNISKLENQAKKLDHPQP